MKKILLILIILLFSITIIVYAEQSEKPSFITNEYWFVYDVNGSYIYVDSNYPLKVDNGYIFYKGDCNIRQITGAWQYSGSGKTVYTSITNLNGEIFSSNHDIRRLNDTVFFSHLTPILSPQVSRLNLNQMSHLVAGLTVSLIGFWVIYLAFSKVWLFLLKQLRGA